MAEGIVQRQAPAGDGLTADSNQPDGPVLKNFPIRRKVRKVFGNVVNEETCDALLGGPSLDKPALQSGRYAFVFVSIRQESIDQLSKSIEQVLDLCIEHAATVQAVFGTMVLLTFGTSGPVKPALQSQSKLVKALGERFPRNLKILHGAVDGHFGLFGGKNRIAYTFTFPRFEEALAALGQLEFGEAREFK